jgi:ribosomal protein S18 acetylase RimI-like enzyme
MTDRKLVIGKANLQDAQEILFLQKLAFKSEAKTYSDLIPPLTETLDEVKTKFTTHLILKAVIDGKIVGSIRVLSEYGTCHVGRLIVHPDFQNQGIATRLLLETERLCSSCGRFELFTGHKSLKAIHLYEKVGYKIFKIEEPALNVKLVFLEKVR